MATATEKNKCAHEACACEVPVGQVYCSPYCAEAAVNPRVGIHAPCRCGHRDCEAAHAEPS